jgi:hypothetical protein
MTTEKHPHPRSGLGALSLRPGVLGGVFVTTVVAGALLVALAGLLDGGDGAVGALVGAGLVVAVLAFGCVNLSLVARVLPAATLPVALGIYFLQAVLLVLVAVRLSRTDLFGDGPARLWLGIGLMAATLTWTTAQLVLTARARIPIYELPETPADQRRDVTRAPARTGGER